jgi:ubiquinone/menaquinone biosynthesis C-methylase UbiE
MNPLRMLSVRERESTEKTCSASNALQKKQPLRMGEKVVNRYLAPPQNTVYPLEYAFHLLGDISGKTVLEYGCGDGPNMVVLSRRGAKVIGLDISSEMLARAKQRLIANQCDGAMLVLGSGHTLPLPDASVDVVFGISILHHLDLEIASREVHRVLKEGGRAIFLEPLRNSRLLMQMRQLFPERSGASPFERPLTDEEIRNFAATSEYHSRTFHLILSRLATKLPILKSPTLSMCQYIDATLLRFFPSLTYYASINVFQIERVG